MAITTRSANNKAPDFSGRLKAVPTKPGVYLMRNTQGEVIYVGKAASLRNRLRSYFQTPFGKEPKVQVMVSRIADFEYIVAESESEALLLENLLIKQHKPFYNARLKDDKTYPYIKIDLSEDFPQLYFTRRVLPDGARYFGPFASAGSVRTTMDLLKKLFPYRSCTKVITGIDERPCLEYYINRCVGPCIGAVDQAEYQEVVHQVIQFLEGDSDEVLKSLEAKMASASEQTQFERAAVLRDQVRAIQSVSEAQKVVSARGDDEDVIALAHDQGEAWVELFKVRRGKLIGRDHFLMEGGEVEEPPRMLEEFIQQFYDATPDVPPVLLVQYEVENVVLLEQWLTTKRGAKVSLRVPQRGEKRRLMAMVAENAAQGLNQRRIKWLNESDKVLHALTELQEALNLPELPDRIECYDISNIQGTNSVGSMVVFEQGRPKMSQYRRFQIKNVEGVDDYASMQEMLRRRFKRLGEAKQQAAPSDGDTDNLGTARVKYRRRRRAKTGALAAEDLATGQSTAARESGAGGGHPKEASWGLVPGLVIIDGGKGHLSAVQEVFLELGITDIPLCSLAKQQEEVFLPHMPEPVVLPRTSQGLYLVQRIRDEAHRFAITYHRQRRSKSAMHSALDDVAGVGPKRKRALLRQFGTVAGIRAASLEELAAVEGMTMVLARKVQEGVGGEEQA